MDDEMDGPPPPKIRLSALPPLLFPSLPRPPNAGPPAYPGVRFGSAGIDNIGADGQSIDGSMYVVNASGAEPNLEPSHNDPAQLRTAAAATTARTNGRAHEGRSIQPTNQPTQFLPETCPTRMAMERRGKAGLPRLLRKYVRSNPSPLPHPPPPEHTIR